MEQPIVRTLIRCVERKLRRRATDLWNVENSWTQQRLCWHTRQGPTNASGSSSVSHDDYFLGIEKGI
jgi:hypothetical protein